MISFSTWLPQDQGHSCSDALKQIRGFLNLAEALRLRGYLGLGFLWYSVRLQPLLPVYMLSLKLQRVRGANHHSSEPSVLVDLEF